MTGPRLRVVVVDDERPARAKILRLLEGDDRFEVVGESADGLSALQTIEAFRPDVVFLDVQMPGLNGFQVLDALAGHGRFAVVFSTAHDEHALRAFDVHAVDYLLKPYDAQRFAHALDKAVARLSLHDNQGQRAVVDLLGSQMAATREKLVVRSASGWVALNFEAILRVTADNKHVWITCVGARHRVRARLSVIEARLDAERFVRVHRSEIVNVGAVVRFESWEHGDGMLTLDDGSCVVLTRTFRQAFVERYGRPLGG